MRTHATRHARAARAHARTRARSDGSCVVRARIAQFHNECEKERGAIIAAARDEAGSEQFEPELVYIVAQQRTNLRLAALNAQGETYSGKGGAGNVPCGTVIDSDIVSLPPGGQQGKPNNNFVRARSPLASCQSDPSPACPACPAARAPPRSHGRRLALVRCTCTCAVHGESVVSQGHRPPHPLPRP